MMQVEYRSFWELRRREILFEGYCCAGCEVRKKFSMDLQVCRRGMTGLDSRRVSVCMMLTNSLVVK